MSLCDCCRESPGFSTVPNRSLVADWPHGCGPVGQARSVRLCDVCASDRMRVGREPCFHEGHAAFATPLCKHPDHDPDRVVARVMGS